MTKIEMVTEMVNRGYCLFEETVEQFAERFTEEQIANFLKAFKAYKGF